MKWALIFLGIAIAGLFYIRLAPSDAAHWHKMPEDFAPKTLAGGGMRANAGDATQFERLIAIAQNSPRTTLMAGGAKDKLVTFVTRTPVIGFPDYTTMRLNGDQIDIYGRLRFGRRDFGVNATRIESWLKMLHAKG